MKLFGSLILILSLTATITEPPREDNEPDALTIRIAQMADPACLECHDNYADHTGEAGHLLVECNGCHGTPNPAISIEQTHEELFKPGMEQFKDPGFCLRCHKK